MISMQQQHGAGIYWICFKQVTGRHSVETGCKYWMSTELEI